MPSLSGLAQSTRSSALSAVFFVLLVGGCGVRLDLPDMAGDPDEVPSTMLWAWHGSHELRFLDPETQGIAVLAGTVLVSNGSVALMPGARRVDAPDGTVFLPVVRIEIEGPVSDATGDRILDEVAGGVLGFDVDRFPGLQLDFDATASQRPFYRRLLQRVRDALGARFLSVTALPSWCLGDSWLPTEIIDELVPMVYRMGPDAETVRTHLDSGGDFIETCRGAVGVSSDEPVPMLRQSGRRVYLFSSERWSPGSVERLTSRLRGSRVGGVST